MPYFELDVPGDGDCLFHAIAALNLDARRPRDIDQWLAAIRRMNNQVARLMVTYAFTYEWISKDAAGLRLSLADELWSVCFEEPSGIPDEWPVLEATTLCDDRRDAMLLLGDALEHFQQVDEELPDNFVQIFDLYFQDAAGCLNVYTQDCQELLERYILDFRFMIDEPDRGPHIWAGGQLERVLLELDGIKIIEQGAIPLAKQPEKLLYHVNNNHFKALVWRDAPLPPQGPGLGSQSSAKSGDRFYAKEKQLAKILDYSRYYTLSRNTLNTLAREFKVGVAVWNINHLGKVDPVSGEANASDRDEQKRQKKNRRKVDALIELLKANRTWLDVFALNEVNEEGMGALSGYLPGGWAIASGPLMVSTTGAVNARPGQKEYYPLLYRSTRFEYEGCFTVNSMGKSVPAFSEVTEAEVGGEGKSDEKQNGQKQSDQQQSNQKQPGKEEAKPPPQGTANDPYVWIKPKNEREHQPAKWYPQNRPVVVHKLRQIGGLRRPLNVAIIHTTPSGNEFERRDVFLQLAKFFDFVAAEAKAPKGEKPLWIITGDFYLFGESIVLGKEEQKSYTLTAEIGKVYSDLERPENQKRLSTHLHMPLGQSKSVLDDLASTSIPEEARKSVRKLPQNETASQTRLEVVEFLKTIQALTSTSIADKQSLQSAIDRLEKVTPSKVVELEQALVTSVKHPEMLFKARLESGGGSGAHGVPISELQAIEADIEKDMKLAASQDWPFREKFTYDGKELTRAQINVDMRFLLNETHNQRELFEATAESMKRLKPNKRAEIQDPFVRLQTEGLELLAALGTPESLARKAAELIEAASTPSGAEAHSVTLAWIYHKSALLAEFLNDYMFAYQNALDWMADCWKEAELMQRKLDRKSTADSGKKQEQEQNDGTQQADQQPGADEEDKDEFVPTFSFYRRNREWSTKTTHRLRNALGYTFRAQLADRFHVLHTVWGTNIHPVAALEVGEKRDFCHFRIADFMICSRDFGACDIGLCASTEIEAAGGLVRADGDWAGEEWEDFPHTKAWRELSDHFPVGGVFSLRPHDLSVEQPFLGEDAADKVAVKNVLHLMDFHAGLPANLQLPGKAGEWAGIAEALTPTERCTAQMKLLLRQIHACFDAKLIPEEHRKSLDNITPNTNPALTAVILRELAFQMLQTLPTVEQREERLRMLAAQMQYSTIWPGMDEFAGHGTADRLALAITPVLDLDKDKEPQDKPRGDDGKKKAPQKAKGRGLKKNSLKRKLSHRKNPPTKKRVKKIPLNLEDVLDGDSSESEVNEPPKKRRKRGSVTGKKQANTSSESKSNKKPRSKAESSRDADSTSDRKRGESEQKKTPPSQKAKSGKSKSPKGNSGTRDAQDKKRKRSSGQSAQNLHPKKKQKRGSISGTKANPKKKKDK